MCSCHSILESCLMFSGVKLSIKSFVLFRGPILSSSYVVGGLFAPPPYRKPTSTLNSLTKFGMCTGLCMNFKFQL